MSSPVSAVSTSLHYQVKDDGRFYIGDIRCTVKRAGVAITKREDLEKIAAVFNKCLQPVAIEPGEEWHFKPDSIVVYAGGKVKNKVVAFKSDAAKDEYQKELQELLKRLVSVQNNQQ